jgi:hypothetical protein
MHKYGKSKTTRIMMATVRHVNSRSGLRKFQAAWFLFNRRYIRLFLTLRRINVFATQCFYVFLPILKSKNDYFLIHLSPIGLSEGNSVLCEVRTELYMYMYIAINFRNKLVLYVMRLFASCLVWGLGKLSLAQVFVRILRFSSFNIIQNLLIKKTILKSKLCKFYINKQNTKFS